MVDPELAAFLEGGVVIHIGTRNEQLEPNGGRGAGLSVEPDGTHVVVYVPEVAIARLRSDLEANGLAAVVATRPTDDRSCQLKGVVTGMRPARDDERAVVAARWQAQLAVLREIGIPSTVLQGWVTWPCAAVRLRVTAIFDQTPRQGAGNQIA